MTTKTNKVITDVRFGQTLVNELKLGEVTVWKRGGGTSGGYGEDMPQSSELLCCYFAEGYSGASFPGNFGDGSWVEGLSQQATAVTDSMKRTFYRPEMEGVAIYGGGFSQTFDSSLTSMTFYYRTKCYPYNSAPNSRLKMHSTDGRGFSIAYQNNRLTYFHNTTATTSKTAVLSTDAQSYHTIAISVLSPYAYVYCDGTLVGSFAYRDFGRNFTITGSDTDAPIVLQAVAVYSGSHDADTVQAVTSYFNNRFTYATKSESERIMLYNAGDMCSSLTGGWEGWNPATSHGTATFADSYISLVRSENENALAGGCITSSAMNLSGCKKIFFKASIPCKPNLDETFVGDGLYCSWLTAAGDLFSSDFSTYQLTSVYGTTEEAATTFAYDLPSDKSAVRVGLFNSSQTAAKIYAIWAE